MRNLNCKLLEENIGGKSLCDLVLGNNYLHMALKALSIIKEQIDK